MLSSKPKISFYLTLLIISTLFISDSVAMGAGGKTYYYDTNGRLVNEALHSNDIMEYQYDLNGNVKRKIRTNNMLVNPNFELNASKATDIASGTLALKTIYPAKRKSLKAGHDGQIQAEVYYK